MMNKLNSKIVMLCFLSLLMCTTVWAQDDSADTMNIPGSASDNVHVLKLKKSYTVGDGISLRSANGIFNIKQTLQTEWLFSSPNSNLTAMTSTFSINRARLILSGGLFDKKITMMVKLNLVSNFQSATTGTRAFNNTVEEIYAAYSPSQAHTFILGLRADYIDSREIRIESENWVFLDRSAMSSAFDPIFDYGIRYTGIYNLGGKNVLKPYLSITTGDGRAGLQKNYSGFKYGIRLDYLPFGEFTSGGESYMDDLARETKPKLVAGVVYSLNNGASSAYGTNGGRYLYGDVNQKILDPNFTKEGFDYLFKYRGFYSLGEIYHTAATIPPGIAGEFKLTGAFTPYTGQTPQQIQSTVLSRLDLGTGFNVQGGYLWPSNWALGFRYSYLNPDIASLSTYAIDNRNFSLVLTKYLSKNNLKITTEIGYNELQNSLKVGNQVGNLYAGTMMTVQL